MVITAVHFDAAVVKILFGKPHHLRPSRIGTKPLPNKLSKSFLVDLVGIEPTTSSMPWKRAPKLRHRPTNGGMQLSYFRRLS
jgi:hypothetical protein